MHGWALFLNDTKVDPEHRHRFQVTRTLERANIRGLEPRAFYESANFCLRRFIVTTVKAIGTCRSELRVAKICGPDGVERFHDFGALRPAGRIGLRPHLALKCYRPRFKLLRFASVTNHLHGGNDQHMPAAVLVGSGTARSVLTAA